MKKMKDKIGDYILYNKYNRSLPIYYHHDTKELFLVEEISNKDIIIEKQKLEKLKNNYNNEYSLYKGSILKKDGNYFFYLYCNAGHLDNIRANICKEEQDKIYNKNLAKNNIETLDEIYIQDFVKKIIEGLKLLHDHGIVHSALSSTNIWANFKNQRNKLDNNKKINIIKISEELLDPNNIELKILFFISSKSKKSYMEQLSNMKYMPLEVLDLIWHKNNYTDLKDPSIDIWSLGVITFKLLTNKLPFEGNTINEIMNSIKEGKITFPGNLCPSKEIISFIRGLLELDPKKRLTLEQIKEHDFIKIDPVKFTFIELEKDFHLFLNNSDTFIQWHLLNGTGIKTEEPTEKELLSYYQNEKDSEIKNIVLELQESQMKLVNLKSNNNSKKGFFFGVKADKQNRFDEAKRKVNLLTTKLDLLMREKGAIEGQLKKYK